MRIWAMKKQTQFYLPSNALIRACPEIAVALSEQKLALSVVEWAERGRTEVRCRMSEITCL